jgi:hypothetical protein
VSAATFEREADVRLPVDPLQSETADALFAHVKIAGEWIRPEPHGTDETILFSLTAEAYRDLAKLGYTRAEVRQAVRDLADAGRVEIGDAEEDEGVAVAVFVHQPRGRDER